MANPCPAHIGCAGDCNECSYIGGVKVKCYNVSCHSNDRQEENNCSDYTDFLKSVCDNFISEDAYNIKQLQAELKLYKRAVDDLIIAATENNTSCGLCYQLEYLNIKVICPGCTSPDEINVRNTEPCGKTIKDALITKANIRRTPNDTIPSV